MSDSYLQASAVRSQDLHRAGSSASEAAVREAFAALAFADMAPLVAGEPWDRAGLPLAARASAERLTRQRDGMKPYVRHKLSLLEYSPLDTLDAPGRALILGHFGAACHRHSRPHRTIQDDRALGSLVGLAIGDAVGAPLEFLDAVDERGTEFACRRDGELQYELSTASFANQFNLKPGQAIIEKLISPISPPYLPHISPISPLYLPCILASGPTTRAWRCASLTPC